MFVKENIKTNKINSKLITSDADLINFFKLSSDLLLVSNFQGIIENASLSLLKITGFDDVLISSISFSDLFHFDDQTSAQIQLMNLQAGDKIKTFEGRLRCNNGKYLWTEWNISPSNEFNHFYAIGRDISERKNNEDALKYSEQKHRTLFETMTQGVIYEETGKGILSANPAAQKILGLTLEQMQGKSSLTSGYKSILEDGTEVIDDAHPAMVALNMGKEVQNFVMGILTPYDEVYRWINVNAVPLFKSGEDKPYQVYTTFDDITERKHADEAIKESEERYRQLVELSPNTVGILKDEKIMFINAAGVLLFGAENLNQVVGKSINDFIHHDNYKIISEELKKLELNEKTPLLEIKANKLDGTLIYLEVTAMPFYYKGENAVQFICSDISERKKVEEERERLFNKIQIAQDRLKILSKRLIEAQESERRVIARELHDEIGQTLTAIKINLQAVNKVTKSSKLKSHLVDSVELVEHSLQLVRNLSLDLRPSMLDDLGLIPTVGWYINKQSQRSGISIKMDSIELDKKLSPDIEVTCYRVIQEAINNVIRHSEAKNVKIEFKIIDNQLRLEIQDDGKGFDVMEVRKRALNGNSIGVLGMQERVELAGGELSIYSSPENGTNVIACFPLSEK